VLRRIFEPKREEVSGGWKNHKEELCNVIGGKESTRKNKT
jgi:hypothetical protein